MVEAQVLELELELVLVMASTHSMSMLLSLSLLPTTMQRCQRSLQRQQRVAALMLVKIEERSFLVPVLVMASTHSMLLSLSHQMATMMSRHAQRLPRPLRLMA